MKRAALSFIILFLIIAYSAGAAVIIKKENSRLYSLLEEIRLCCEKNDKESAEKYASELTALWKSYERKMSVFIDDEKLLELGASVAKIRPYAEEANDELEAELENIRRRLELIYTAELPYWYNLL